MSASGRLLRRAATVTAALCALALGPVAGASAAPTPSGPLNYVNMGDSYSAGSGILPLAAGSQPDCTRSQLNWAHDLATTHGYELTDVSCGGAQTKDYRSPQFPDTPPQLAALSRSTQLVTMTIGGNDNNVFVNTIALCGAAAATTAGQGNPCEQRFGSSFSDTIRTSTYPNLVRALKDVRARAPKARVAIAGYLRILPPTTGCYPIMPVASGDVPYLNGIQATLNDAVARAAAQTGVTYIDVTPASTGHDACQPIGTRWIEPPVGGTNYIAVHPNAAGEAAMADQATAQLGLG